jgi:hypothetical protein
MIGDFACPRLESEDEDDASVRAPLSTLSSPVSLVRRARRARAGHTRVLVPSVACDSECCWAPGWPSQALTVAFSDAAVLGRNLEELSRTEKQY